MAKTRKIKTKTNKKGELTSGQIISLIILILSFVIILFVLWKTYTWNPIIDKESCHQSVVFRSSVNFGFIKSSKVVPLKCQTEKMCMTMSGQDCLQVGKNTKTNIVTPVKLDKDPEIARQQLLDKITEAMYDCHSMLGEGKLQFVPETWFQSWKMGEAVESGNPNDIGKKHYCLICSRIVLDDEARQKLSDITYSELYLALSRKTTPDKKTYLEYLYPDWKDWHYAYQLFQKLKEENEKNKDKYNGVSIANMKFEDWKMNLSDEGGFAIIAQESAKDYSAIVAGTAAAVVGTALVATGVGAPAGISLIGAGVVGGATFWYNSPTGDYKYSPPTVEPYNLERLQSMQCDSFETAP
jgi:hypothetical protein